MYDIVFKHYTRFKCQPGDGIELEGAIFGLCDAIRADGIEESAAGDVAFRGDWNIRAFIFILSLVNEKYPFFSSY